MAKRVIILGSPDQQKVRSPHHIQVTLVAGAPKMQKRILLL